MKTFNVLRNGQARNLPPAHDPLVCGLDEAGQRPTCPGCAFAFDTAKAADLPWPGGGQARPGDLQLIQLLGLARFPRVLNPQERKDLLLQFLDAQRTAERHPAWCAEVRKILRDLLAD